MNVLLPIIDQEFEANDGGHACLKGMADVRLNLLDAHRSRSVEQPTKSPKIVVLVTKPISELG